MKKFQLYFFVLFIILIRECFGANTAVTVNGSGQVVNGGNITFTNKITIGALIYPLVDGSSNYVMTTDGAGNLSLLPSSGGGGSVDTAANYTWTGTNQYDNVVYMGNGANWNVIGLGILEGAIVTNCDMYPSTLIMPGFLNGNSRLLYSSTVNTAIDWQARTLELDSLAGTSLDWQSKIAYGGWTIGGNTYPSSALGAGEVMVGDGAGSFTLVSTNDFAGSGEANTASNIGGGTNVFSSKVGVDLEFKTFLPGSNISFLDTGSNITITAASSALPSGIAFLASNQTFTASNTFTGTHILSNGVTIAGVVLGTGNTITNFGSIFANTQIRSYGTARVDSSLTLGGEINWGGSLDTRLGVNNGLQVYRTSGNAGWLDLGNFTTAGSPADGVVRFHSLNELIFYAGTSNASPVNTQVFSMRLGAVTSLVNFAVSGNLGFSGTATGNGIGLTTLNSTNLVGGVNGKLLIGNGSGTYDFVSTNGLFSGGGGLASVTNTRSIKMFFDGAGSPIVVGTKRFAYIPFTGTILGATMIADQTGYLTVDVLKTNYPNYIVTAPSIAASALPKIVNATKSQDFTLTGWGTSVVSNDCVGFNVTISTNCTWGELTLTVREVLP